MIFRIPLTVSALLLLAACAEPSTWQAPEPAPSNAGVAAMLPQGPFTVEGGRQIDGEMLITIEGYVDFGTAPDGTECAAEYTLSGLGTGENPPMEAPTEVRVVHNPGGPTWYQDASDPATPGEWRDISDPEASGVVLLFVPAIITSSFSSGVVEGAGTGELCSIPAMPRFMASEGDRLVFDRESAAASIAAGRGRWAEKFADAAGLTGRGRDEAIEELFALAEADFGGLTDRSYLAVSETGEGVVEVLQYANGDPEPLVRLTFTPAEEREVELVAAKTYFERVADEVRRSGARAGATSKRSSDSKRLSGEAPVSFEKREPTSSGEGQRVPTHQPALRVSSD